MKTATVRRLDRTATAALLAAAFWLCFPSWPAAAEVALPSFTELALCSALAGVGGALTVAGSGLYLADISTPRNRARTTAPFEP